MRALNIGTIRSRKTDTVKTRFRFVLDNYQGSPTLSLYRYTRGDSFSGLVAPWGRTAQTVRLPHVTFAFAYKHKRFGILRLYRWSGRFYIWAANGC